MTDAPETPVTERPPGWFGRRQFPFFLESIAIGVVHGMLARLTFGLDAMDGVLGVMTASFIFLVPFSIGVATVAWASRSAPRWSWLAWIAAPVVPAVLALMAALVLAWEGLICIFLWLPLYVVLAMAGGLVAGIVAKTIEVGSRRNLALMGLVALPYLTAPIEQQWGLPEDIREVSTSIDIDAPEAVVWANIVRVPAFQEDEHHFAWVHALGFPRPIEATLSHEGVGGVRHATFEGNVVFVETITDWQDQRRLAFAIAVDASAIPATTLDEHVTVGGPYFDVLDGIYELEPLPTGGVRLHLASHHRLSTRFNVYAALWTDFIMRDVQRYILDILKARCEAA